PVGSARVTGIDNDTTTYRIGVGRKFTDAISGFARVTYEPGNGDVLSRLSPTDGSIAYGFGGSYTNGAIKVTGGVEYITFGEGDDNENALLATNFSDNDAVAVGLSVGYRF
ncbi:MAG: transporter, partial [Loktanella salsilacus]